MKTAITTMLIIINSNTDSDVVSLLTGDATLSRIVKT